MRLFNYWQNNIITGANLSKGRTIFKFPFSINIENKPYVKNITKNYLMNLLLLLLISCIISIYFLYTSGSR